MTPQDLQDCWTAVFPNSASVCTTSALFGALCLRGVLAKDLTECPNHIIDNDPLMYIGGISADGSTWTEFYAYMYVQPTQLHLAYSSTKLRRKTIKNVTREKLVKRFQEVRKFVLDNAHNLKNPMFDITTK